MTHGGLGSDPFGGAPFGHNPFGAPPAGLPTPAPPPHQRDDTNTPATLSIIFAFLFAPAGAVLGHLGLARSNRTGGRGRDRALIGLTLSYLIVVIAVVALVIWAVTGRHDATPTVVATPNATAPSPTSVAEPTTSAAAAPTVDAAAMPGLLLSLEEVKTLMGDPNMVSETTYNDVEPLTPEQGTFEPLDCIGAFAAGVPQPYQGSNYRKYLATTQIDRHAGPQVGQSVAIFDDAAAAQRALANYIDDWRRCANTSATSTTPAGGPQTVNLGAPVDAGGGITTLRVTIVGVPAVFYRTLAAKNNVLIDNQFGATSLTDQPIVLTKRILERIPG